MHVHAHTLQAFFGREELDGSESYKCESCKQRCHHSKAMQLWHPPPVLLLSLKRFSQKSSSGLFSRFRCVSFSFQERPQVCVRFSKDSSSGLLPGFRYVPQRSPTPASCFPVSRCCTRIKVLSPGAFCRTSLSLGAVSSCCALRNFRHSTAPEVEGP